MLPKTIGLFVVGMSAFSMTTGCFGSSQPVPQPPRIARYTSEWTATAHKHMCEDGDFNGKYVLNPGFGVGGREITTFPDGFKMYTVYETYIEKTEISPPFDGALAITIKTRYLNRYDFYVNENDDIIKCVPRTTQLSSKSETAFR